MRQWRICQWRIEQKIEERQERTDRGVREAAVLQEVHRPIREKRRHLKVEQTREPQGDPWLPGPDEVEWNRFVRGQRR